MDNEEYQRYATALLCSGSLDRLLDESGTTDYPDYPGPSYYAANYKMQGSGSKGLAVRKDGRYFRIYTTSCYNDRFLPLPCGRGCTLQYVCGNVEEIRRQKGLLPGTPVTVVISRKKPEKHVVLEGRFDGIMVKTTLNADQDECQREYSNIAITHVTPPESLPTQWTAETLARAAPAPVGPGGDAPAGEPFAEDCRHMVFDTESAAPDQSGRARTAHPILQFGYVITDSRFEDTFERCESLLRYPDSAWTGNSLDRDVNKFTLKRMERGGEDAAGALKRLYAAIDRTDGCLVAHNADHDLRQLERSAEVAGYHRVKRPVRVFDSCKCANRIMSIANQDKRCSADRRYPKLRDLAEQYNLHHPEQVYHESLDDAKVLLEIVKRWPLDLISIFTYTVEV